MLSKDEALALQRAGEAMAGTIMHVALELNGGRKNTAEDAAQTLTLLQSTIISVLLRVVDGNGDDEADTKVIEHMSQSLYKTMPALRQTMREDAAA